MGACGQSALPRSWPPSASACVASAEVLLDSPPVGAAAPVVTAPASQASPSSGLKWGLPLGERGAMGASGQRALNGASSIAPPRLHGPGQRRGHRS
jgi:hypothetical protein